MKRLLIFSLFFSLTAFMPLSFAYAVDFGALVKGEVEIAGQDETNTSGTVLLSPWLTVPFNVSELYISAGLKTSIADETVFIPELHRLEFSSRPTSLFSFRVGRFNWGDPSRLVASGLFDGVDLLFDLGKVRLGVNALYTGFLYKETAEINVSPTDPKANDYIAALDWGNFADTYFAPRRLMVSYYGEFPGLPSNRGRLYAGILAQFDLSDAEERFHTQYLLLRHSLVFGSFDLDASGALELENTDAYGIQPGFAFSVEGGWQLPTAVKDRLSLGVTWASGEGSATASFFPIVESAQGYVLTPSLSGMMFIKANYEARLLASLSANLGIRYFIRNDSTSFTAPYLEDKSYPLGMELFTSLLWAPFSDLTFYLNGGVFLPKTGSAWADNAPVLWKITMGTLFSF